MGEQANHERLAAQVCDVLGRYTEAFEQGDLDGVSSFVQFPLAYIGDNKITSYDRYPFDPARLKEKTGFDHTRVDIDVVAIDDQKAHAVLKGTRHRADGSVIEGINAVYILLNGDAGWKIAAFSGVRTPAEQLV